MNRIDLWINRGYPQYKDNLDKSKNVALQDGYNAGITLHSGMFASK